MDSKMFFGGVPTNADVKKLRDAYPAEKLVKGTLILYQDVEKVLNLSRKSDRFRTVTNRWRREIERETRSVVIGTKPGEGFTVLSEHEKVGLSTSKLQSSVRHARRSLIVTTRVDVKDLSEDDRTRLTSTQQRVGALLAVSQIRRDSDLPNLLGAPA